MRTIHQLTLALAVFAVGFAACTETPESTVQTQLGGPYTIEEFTKNAAYSAWYETGYNAYPPAENKADFDMAVERIRTAMEAGEGEYSVLMAVKPNCSCQHTQREMPRVMKTLDMAGFPHQNIEIYITDTRIAGIDEIKQKHNIDKAPTFIVLRDDVEMGRFVEQPSGELTVEEELAAFFDA